MTSSWRIGDAPELVEPTGGRPQDCIVGGGRNRRGVTLLGWLVDTNAGRASTLQVGWRVLDPDDIEAAARFLHHAGPSTTVNELREIAKRLVIELVALGDGQYRYRLTDLGETIYLERC